MGIPPNFSNETTTVRWMFLISMKPDSLPIPTDQGPDWKGIGYLVSIVSVFFLGAIAWPKPEDPEWHLPVLIAGMAASILGMGFRYLAHRKQQAEIKKTKAEARSS
jgi:hypothetical protein